VKPEASSRRLMSKVSYAPELSEDEAAILAALTDEQKLAVAHAIHLASVALRQEIATAARWKAAHMRREENLPRLSGPEWVEHFASDLEAGVWRDHLPIETTRRRTQRVS
jgi:hypothetical protein